LGTVGAFIGAIGKYSWRIFLGIFCAAGFVLLFAGKLGFADLLPTYRPLAWILLVLAGVISATYLVTYLIEWHAIKPKKGKIAFFPDANNNGWSKQHETQMNLRVCGTFTYSGGAGQVLIMKMYLKRTKSLDDVHPQFIVHGGKTVSPNEWLLNKDMPEKVMLDLRLTPVIGKSKQPLRAKLILKDNIHREFKVGEFEFPYIGP
jgi:hypothetical protein